MKKILKNHNKLTGSISLFNVMYRAFLGAKINLLIVLVVLIGLAGCENPGSIGSELGKAKASVAVDTFAISNVGTQSLDYYSGGFSYFSAGQYNDPLFGDIKATGLIKPALPLNRDFNMTSDAKMIMRLFFDGSQVYGDSTAGQSFDAYEIIEPWRSAAVKWGDELDLNDDSGPLMSFTASSNDSVDVEISSEWVKKYRTYVNENADSLYRIEQFGLAFVPSGSDKIIAPNIDSTKFVIQEPEGDTVDVQVSQAASTLNRTNTQALPDHSVAWHSTNESLLQFDLNLSNIDVDASNISKAEIVFYQNNELLQRSLSSEPSTVVRPENTSASLYFIDPKGLPANITPGNPVARGSYSTDDEAFHFPFTSQLQNLLTRDVPEDRSFVVVLSNDGIIKSTVIYTDNAPAMKKPKVIITSLKNSGN